MTPKLPVLSGDDLIKILEKFGYVLLRHSTDAQRNALTVPLHKPLKRGLLHRLLRDARITEEQLSGHL